MDNIESLKTKKDIKTFTLSEFIPEYNKYKLEIDFTDNTKGKYYISEKQKTNLVTNKQKAGNEHTLQAVFNVVGEKQYYAFANVQFKKNAASAVGVNASDLPF